MNRETTISVSYEEKNKLDEAKHELFSTEEVPYGVVISELTAQLCETEE